MKDHLLAVPFVNRPDLLEKAVASVRELSPVVLDNSVEGLDTDFLSPYQVEILRPPVKLTVAQSMNWMVALARERGCKYPLQMHSDGCAAPGVGLRLLEIARQATAEGRKWAVIFTNYDVLAAYNLKAIDDVGLWDQAFYCYWSDVDFHRRCRLAGYELIESGLEVSHVGSATIHSDPELEFETRQSFDICRAYYEKKWGGPSEQEAFIKPFNR